MVDLLVDGISDIRSKENFEKLNEEVKRNPFLSGEWAFFEVEVEGAGTVVPIKHGLPFIPKDVIITGIRGDYTVYFRTDLSDADFLYVYANGLSLIRFIAGRLG